MFDLRKLGLSLTIRILFGTACLALAGGCSSLSAGGADPTLTPIPTSSFPGIQSIPSQACLVAEQVVIRVDNPQGDLVAWSPTEDVLAYVAPSSESAWLLGNLMAVTAPAFDAPVELAVRVFGNLTWSPQGNVLAFVGLRTGDGLYTVEVASADGQNPTRDLFPGEAARSDEWSSQKAIQGWRGPDRLAVLVSCGLDCMQPLEMNLVTGGQTLSGQAQPRPQVLWAIHTNPPEDLPEQVAGSLGQPNASPDGGHFAYIDAQGNAWVVVVDGEAQFPLEIGAFRDAFETDWSPSGEYLAVRADDRLMVFSFDCP